MGEFIGNKPSSRVLRPPGGQTSNIFGGSDEAHYGEKSANTKPTFRSSVFNTEPEPVKPQNSTNRQGNTSNIILGAESDYNNTNTDKKISKTHQSSVFRGPEPLTEEKLKATGSRRDPITGTAANAPPGKPSPPKIVPTSPLEVKGEAKENGQSKPVVPENTKDHNPHLGPVKNTSGVRCAQPPGGKSSISFF